MSSMQLSGFGRGSGVSMGSMSDIMLTCPCSKTGLHAHIYFLIFSLKHRTLVLYSLEVLTFTHVYVLNK